MVRDLSEADTKARGERPMVQVAIAPRRVAPDVRLLRDRRTRIGTEDEVRREEEQQTGR